MDPNKPALSDLELKHGRDVNLLVDSQRPQVANALNQISATMKNGALPANDRLQFFETHVLKNFLCTFDSQFDSIREAALGFVRLISDLQKNASHRLSSESQTAILARILSRVSTVPFKEQSEEVRLVIIKTLVSLVPLFDDGFHRMAGETVQAVASLLQDKFPEAKKQGCVLLEALMPLYAEQTAANSKKLLLQLCNNCFHAHSKIRRVSIDTMAKVLVLPRVGENVKTAVEALGPLAYEKLPEIREAVYRCYAGCLDSLSFESLKENEVFLLCELMAGIEDENPAISKVCSEAVTRFADRRKEFFEKFGS